MQRHHRLAGAGTTADRDDTLVGGADRTVLLGLDRRHDRVHRPVAGPSQLGKQRALTDDRQVGLGLGVEQVVLDSQDVDALAAQDPAADDALRVGLGGLVEHRGGRCAPVDEQHVVVGVAQPDPADVARHLAELRAQVETTEDQALVGGVQRGHPAGSLEDHRVALDQPALVADAAASESLLGQLLRRSGRFLELVVDGVDVLLLARDLACGHVTVQRWCPSMGNGQSEEPILLVRRACVRRTRSDARSRAAVEDLPADAAEGPARTNAARRSSCSTPNEWAWK